MGKGTIIEDVGGGEYRVRIIYSKASFNNKIDASDNRIDQLDILIPTLSGKEKTDAESLKSATQTNKKTLEGVMPPDPTVSAWCADFTEGLSGEIGTCEVPGEFKRTKGDIGQINIAPGFADKSVYDKTRDGQLNPVANMTSANVYRNLCLLPGWQKWKPTYRYGKITSIDNQNNTCDLTLDPAESTQQGLDINQTGALSDVQIEYMNCDYMAFDIGDEVLIKFEGQSWDNPKVIGFKTDPKECFGKFYLRPKIDGHRLTRGGWLFYIGYTDKTGAYKQTPLNRVEGNINGGDPRRYWICEDQFDLSDWDHKTDIDIHLSKDRSRPITDGIPESWIKYGRFNLTAFLYYSTGENRYGRKFYWGLKKERAERYGKSIRKPLSAGCFELNATPDFELPEYIHLTLTGSINDLGTPYTPWEWGALSPLVIGGSDTTPVSDGVYAGEHIRRDTIKIGLFSAVINDPDTGEESVKSYKIDPFYYIRYDSQTGDTIRQNFIDTPEYTELRTIKKTLTADQVFALVSDEEIWDGEKYVKTQVMNYDFIFKMVTYRTRKPMTVGPFYNCMDTQDPVEYEEIKGFPKNSMPLEMYLLNPMAGGRLVEDVCDAPITLRSFYKPDFRDGMKYSILLTWAKGYEYADKYEHTDTPPYIWYHPNELFVHERGVQPDTFDDSPGNGWNRGSVYMIGPQTISGYEPKDYESLKDNLDVRDNLMHIVTDLDPSLSGTLPGTYTFNITREFAGYDVKGFYYKMFDRSVGDFYIDGGLFPQPLYKLEQRHKEGEVSAETDTINIEIEKETMPSEWF